ncbi:hypothetical protein MUK42_34681 [Musa troglodytarum]|uniref:Uncharacterized protein n=1 Tax=Musa troglodytarum TaxID=320322 RepID=A0A9E7KKN4_9LILI|nr:hypothetical protein MUK42_34681 [Musa troglodytarum]
MIAIFDCSYCCGTSHPARRACEQVAIVVHTRCRSYQRSRRHSFFFGRRHVSDDSQNAEHFRRRRLPHGLTVHSL